MILTPRRSSKASSKQQSGTIDHIIMASDEIDMDLVLGAGGVVDSYTNSDAVGELLPNINADDPALLGLDIDMSATATEVRAYCESIRIRWIINLIAFDSTNANGIFCPFRHR